MTSLRDDIVARSDFYEDSEMNVATMPALPSANTQTASRARANSTGLRRPLFVQASVPGYDSYQSFAYISDGDSSSLNSFPPSPWDIACTRAKQVAWPVSLGCVSTGCFALAAAEALKLCWASESAEWGTFATLAGAGAVFGIFTLIAIDEATLDESEPENIVD